MKKIISIVISLTILAGCAAKLTKEDLTKNDWEIESKKDEPSMVVHFSDDKVSIKLDTESMQSSAANEWEGLGEEYAKQIIDDLSFDFNYTLNKNEMVWKNDDSEAKYTVKKENNNIILVPNKSNETNNSEELTLKPYNNKSSKRKETSKAFSSSSTEMNESTETASSQTPAQESTESEELASVSINDFVGGWGVPNSGNLFFINPDETLSNSNGEKIPLEQLTITSIEGEKTKLSFVMNGMNKELVKNSDGTVTTDDGVTYEYLGNMTLDQYLAQNNK